MDTSFSLNYLFILYMKKHKMVLVKQHTPYKKNIVYKWVSKEIAKHIVDNKPKSELQFEYASRLVTILYKLKSLFSN